MNFEEPTEEEKKRKAKLEHGGLALNRDGIQPMQLPVMQW
jgi:hypothetical protein